MSTIADSAAFPHWVEHDQLLMTAYNAYRASAVIALQYLGRLWLPANRTRRNECANLSPPPRGSSKTCSLTCISPVIHRKDGDCINGGPKHGTISRIALRVSARITQYRFVWTDQYRERDWGTGARSGGVIHAAGVLVGSDV
jgi:hypothetical protein